MAIEQNSHNNSTQQASRARVVGEAGKYRILPEKMLSEPKTDAGTVTVPKRTPRYEVISSADHRVQAWLVDKTDKYKMFFRHLRIT